MIQALLIAVSLCADCFAVTLCSGVTLKKVSPSNVASVAFCFAVIQTGLLLAGWAAGELVSGLVQNVSKWIGFALLLYVGGSMLVEGIRNRQEVRDLDGFVNIILGGLATSMDALSVGVAHSMQGGADIIPLAVSLFAVTAVSVVCGILFGKSAGCRFGRWAEIGGGAVLVTIGITILI